MCNSFTERHTERDVPLVIVSGSSLDLVRGGICG